jgi:ferrous iron transport protein B
MKKLVAIIGNPNSGKTTLFNALTGANQQVGNWSGVTVEKKTGYFTLNDPRETDVKLVDLPGIYNLDHDAEGGSLDERVAFDYIMKNEADLIINVIDASCLERSLYLTVQLKEMGLPVVTVINKMDLAEKKDLLIDEKVLAKGLKSPVLTVSAHNEKSVKEMLNGISELETEACKTVLSLDYGDPLSSLISKFEQLLGNNGTSTQHIKPKCSVKSCPLLDNNEALALQIKSKCAVKKCPLVGSNEAMALHPKSMAIKVIEGDALVLQLLTTLQKNELTKDLKNLDLGDDNDIDLQIADTRYSFIYELTQDATRLKGKLGRSLTSKIDAIVMHRIVGIPFFFFVMYLMFMFSVNIGSAFIDFFDISAGAIFVDGVANLLTAISAPEWIIALLANGVGSGIQTVLTFIPIIGCLYLFLALLESSGYLARAAFVIDKAMQYLGLPGKSFVPMIVGFGCTVPAVMAARTLEKERERLLTVIMSPFMSCGARLPVYALFASAFFPDSGQNIVFLLYFIGIVVAVLTGFVLSRTLLPGKSENLFLELPDYEIPTLNNILIKTWNKLKGFLLGAGQIIIIVVTVLNLINSIAIDRDYNVSFGHENSATSLLSEGAKIVTPLFSPMGISENNWPATVGIVTGLFAKEAVVGTLNNLYSSGVPEVEKPLTMMEKFNEALKTIPENLMGISVSDPLNLNVGDINDLEVAAQEQGVSLTVYTNIKTQFVTAEAGFAYLLFILLYAPCAAAMGAITREVGGNWAKFIAVWTTVIAYLVSVCYYQVASGEPSAILYLIASALIIAIVVYLLHRKGNVLVNATPLKKGTAQ